MRARLLWEINNNPANANQLAKALSVDYKTVKHHLRILLEHKVIDAVNEGNYGAIYVLSDLMKENLTDLEKIWERIGKKNL